MIADCHMHTNFSTDSDTGMEEQVEQDVTENTPLMAQMREDMLVMELLLKVVQDKIL